ncbi:bestrophin family protein [Myroides sp. LJL115]
MIVREKTHVFKMLFTWKGSVLYKIYPTLVAVFIFSWLVYIARIYFPEVIIPLNIGAFTLVGISLAIFLAFCNNAAYDRFWEGRKAWGNLVICSRSIGFQILNYLPNKTLEDKKIQQEAIKIVIAFCYALNYQLREKDDFSKLQNLLSHKVYEKMLTMRFKPAYLLCELTALIARCCREGKIDTITQARIDQNIDQLSNILATCERILHTKIPFVYFVMLHRTVYIYCFLLPFGLINLIVWTMPFIVTFVAYTFLGLDSVVDEIAEPFGEEPNDLALDQMCANIEHSLCEITGLDLPKPVVANKDFIVR